MTRHRTWNWRSWSLLKQSRSVEPHFMYLPIRWWVNKVDRIILLTRRCPLLLACVPSKVAEWPFSGNLQSFGGHRIKNGADELDNPKILSGPVSLSLFLSSPIVQIETCRAHPCSFYCRNTRLQRWTIKSESGGTLIDETRWHSL